MANQNPNQPTTEQSTTGQPPTQQAQPGQQEQKGAAQQPAQQRGAQQPAAAISRREAFAPGPLSRGLLGMTPFSLVRRIMEDLGRMFEDIDITRGTEAPTGRENQRGAAAAQGLWAPPVDVFERDGQLVVRADLPGLGVEDITVEVLDNTLVIEGERHAVAGEERGGRYRELVYGSFRRVIPLPEGVSAENAEARFDSGVLEITLQLSPEQARRRIEVQPGPREEKKEGEAKQQAQEATVH